MRDYDQPSTSGAAEPMPRDEQEAARHREVLDEAAAQATFHRREAERWERIGRAAGAALVELDARAPWVEVTPEEFIERSRPQQVSGARIG